MSQREVDVPGRRRSFAATLGLCLASTALSLAVAEAVLRLSGYEPRLGRATRIGLDVIRAPAPGIPYVYPPHASYEERWPSDPHDYFRNRENAIRYRVNNSGFRGPDFSKPRSDAIRIAVLGDSFAWGNGVRDEDLFTLRLEELLRGDALFGGRFEVYNFGLAGYTTAEEVALFESVALDYRPDVAIVWYFLNDAGMRPTIRYLGGRRRWRGAREKLFVLDLVVHPIDSRLGERRLIRAFQKRHEPGSPALAEVEEALARFARLCRERQVTPVLAIHPVLFRLDADHPFRRAHRNLLDAARRQGIAAFDLLPHFEGRDAESLWVHPVDQHPNHRAHRLAADGFHGDLIGLLRERREEIAASRAAKQVPAEEG